MAVDLTTGSYNEDGIYSKHNDDSSTSEMFNLTENLNSLKNFRTGKILKECLNEKYLVLEGCFVGDDKPAIVIVEKIPFNAKEISRFFSVESRLELKFQNNIYSNYYVYPPSAFNGYNVKVIYPATEKDFSEFVEEPVVMISESIKLYNSTVLPHFEKHCPQKLFSEDDINKVIFDDKDPQSGFTLIEDKPENCTCPDNHIRGVCIVQRKDLRSLRDLTAEHLPLLKRIKETCLKQLTSKYSTPASKFLVYAVYPPSHFPFHIYFETVEKDHPIPAEKAHHLETIIFNLTLVPDYYKRMTLTYSLKESDELLKTIHRVDNNCDK